MRITLGFQHALMVAVLVHCAVLSLFGFTFPPPHIFPKPTIVFLGSFLRDHDFIARSFVDQPTIGVAVINLDVRGDWSDRQVPKPRFSAGSPVLPKYQYKTPLPSQGSTRKEQEDRSDLELGLEPFVPVKLRMGLE